jgi:hypothetical protein
MPVRTPKEQGLFKLNKKEELKCFPSFILYFRCSSSSSHKKAKRNQISKQTPTRLLSLLPAILHHELQSLIH